jgi:hypothetical protein
MSKQAMTDVARLRNDAANAAQVRALTTHPDVVALRVEQVRKQVDRLIWAGLLLGLAFTMVNVQTFAASGAVSLSLAWCAAWLLDPMVSLVLIAVLRAEQITATWQVETIGPWVRRTKVFAFVATYAMNTWQSWQHLNPAGIVLHSVPPVLVYCAAEAGPVLRDRLTEAVLRAAAMATPTAPLTDTTAETDTAAEAGTDGTAGLEPTQVSTDADTPDTADSAGIADQPSQPRTTTRKATPQRTTKRSNNRAGQAKAARKLLADFVADAQAAFVPGETETPVTPAWVRSVVECSRATSKNVADALNADLPTTTTSASNVTDLPDRADEKVAA